MKTQQRASSRGNPWHDEKGRFCSGPKNIEIVGDYDNGVVYGGYDTQEICEEFGIMPEMTDDYGFPKEHDESYDERSPGGAFAEVEIQLNDDNTGEVLVEYQGVEYSETFGEAEGKELRAALERKVTKSEKTKEEYEQRTKERFEEEKRIFISYNGRQSAYIVSELPEQGKFDNGYTKIGTTEHEGKDYDIYIARGLISPYNKSFFAVEKKDDYQISHRPQGIQDAENEEADFATDISRICMPGYYEHPEYYPSYQDERVDKETFEVLTRIRNNPEAEVTVYRGSPKGELNEGDWVTLSPTYAEIYAGEGAYAGEGSTVHSYKVKAKDLVFPGDTIAEFGYWGEPLKEEV